MCERNHRVRLHLSHVDVEHHIGKQPHVHGLRHIGLRRIVLAVGRAAVHCAQRRVLHTEVSVRFHPIGVVVQFLVQSRVHHRQVIPLQVIVHVHLPVAGQVPALADHVLHLLTLKRCHAPRHVLEHLEQRRCLAVDVHEDQRAPLRDLHRPQPHLLRMKIARAFHFRRLEQRSVETVRPAVISALHRGALTAAVRHRAGAMQADVMEGAQRVTVTHHDDRVVADFGSDEGAVCRHLLHAAHQLPGTGENPFAFKLEVDRIVVQPRRYRRGAGNVGIERENQRHGWRGDPSAWRAGAASCPRRHPHANRPA